MEHKREYAFNLIGKSGGVQVIADLATKYECPKCGANIHNAEVYRSKRKIKICLIANGFIDHKENCWPGAKTARE
jgi:predicted RNA-binding Zn-ribbon protein involved in translation (DUF1610 family)